MGRERLRFRFAASLPFRSSRLVALLLQAAFAVGCGTPSDTDSRSDQGEAGSRSGVPASSGAEGASARGEGADAAGYFRDVSSESGLDFVHYNGMSGELFMVEMVGSGVALFDYDRDGDLDVYLVQGHDLPDPGPDPPGDRLYRNELDRPGGRLRFTDVTEEVGIRAQGYGMGVAVGDFDNDGWLDLFVTNYGANQLWRNLGADESGRVRFEDRTREAGIAGEHWSSSATAVDIDADGWLDLYVANYLELDLAERKICRMVTGQPDYCGPHSYPSEHDVLYRNRGDGTFEDVSLDARVARSPSSGLGVSSGDFDDDGAVELYVANDMQPNFFWRRDSGAGEKLELSDWALAAGAAVNREGKAEASMGLATGDADNDGDDEIFITHLAKETHTLYRNDGGLAFDDRTRAFGLETATVEATGFGTCFLDVENDGWLDLAVANGAVAKIESQVRAGDPFPLHQPNQLFRNRGDGTFEDATALAGPAFALSEVSRGLACGDLDNDGDADLVITNNAGPARVLLDQVGQEAAWLGVRLRDERFQRDATGVRVTIELDDGSTLQRTARVDGSFASSSDPRVLFGLGEPGTRSVVRVSARWLDGHEVELEEPAANQYVELTRRADGEEPRP